MKKIIKNIINYFKYFKRKDIFLASNVCAFGASFEGNNKLGKNTVICNSKMGYCSYIGQSCSLSNAVIGRFCSIGNNVKIINSTHPSKTFVSTSPAFFSNKKQCGMSFVHKNIFEELVYLDYDKKISIEIGNDVWIGDDVTIMGGVRIGDGAVIGTKALVTKDVLPFAVVGGVPARLIKYRFSKEQIDFLLVFKWWDKDYAWIKSNFHQFDDIEKFMEINNEKN